MENRCYVVGTGHLRRTGLMTPGLARRLVCGWLRGVVVRRRTRDRKVAGSNPGRDAINSTRSTQLSSKRVPACMAGVRRGAFTCVGWQVTLCDSHMASDVPYSSEMGFPRRAISAFTFTFTFLIGFDQPI